MRSSCCSMRKRVVEYSVYDHAGVLVMKTPDCVLARNQSMAIHGTFKENWVDAQEGR